MKTMPPLVSVCVLTYNHVGSIEKCIRSILAQQTKFDFELLIGEDESNDGTREKCIEFKEKNPNLIRLFLRSRNDVIHINNRPTGRYNLLRTLEESKGKYVAICEGDDFWTDPLKLQKQVDFLENNHNYSLVHHPVEYVNAQNEPLNKRKLDSAINTTEDLAKHNGIMTCSVLFNKEHLSIPRWFNKILMGDWVIWLQLSQVGKVHQLQDKMACYRVHSGGVWSSINHEKGLKIKIDNIKKLDSFLGKKYHSEFKENINYMLFNFLSECKKNKDFKLVIKYFFYCLFRVHQTKSYSIRDLVYVLRKY